MKTVFKSFWLAGALFVGCSTSENPFQKYYQDNTLGKVLETEPYSGNTKIYSSNNLEKDIRNIYRDGYLIIGSSAFNSGTHNPSLLTKHAKHVGADIVLLKSSYAGTFQGSAPVLQYVPPITSTTKSVGAVEVNSWGSGGISQGTGVYASQSATIVPGHFNTSLETFQYQRYEYSAAFFRKMRPTVFGVISRPLTTEMRQKLESNLGVHVWVVRNDSPAYLSGILEDDILVKFNREPILSVQDFSAKVRGAAGQKVTVTVWRSGKEIEIHSTLNPLR